MFFRSKKDKQSKADKTDKELPREAPQAPPTAPEGNSRSLSRETPPNVQSDVSPAQTSQTTQPSAQPEHPSSLTQEDLKNRKALAKRASASFGDIVRVLMQSPEYKGLKLEDLTGLVVPAVATGQFLTAEAQAKNSGQVLPVAAVLWANVSDEVDERLSTELDKPVNLASKEWQSGNNTWLILAAGDRRLVTGMLKQIQTGPYKDRQIKLRMKNQTGQTAVTTVAEQIGLNKPSVMN